jgi:hypothetical protein
MTGFAPPPPARWTGDDDDARLAWKVQALAPPIVLVLAWLATSSGGLSAFLSRVFLGMWIHEIGHALSAWFTGFFAFPGPWRTIVGDERSWSLRFILGAILVFLVVTGVRHRHRVLTVVGGVLLALFVIGAFVIKADTARMVFSFGGDGGNLVLGPLLMLTFQLPREHPIKRRWLHWGFVVIGAFAFCDVAHQWARAADDFAEIPFGRIDGVGLSDASVLVDRHGWSETALVDRYTSLAWLGLLVFVVGHGVGVWRAKQGLDAADDDTPTIIGAPITSTATPTTDAPVVSAPRRPRAPIDL